jgi:CSLREA domain-containing protein
MPRRLLLLGLTIVATGAVAVPSASAATYVVNTTADTADAARGNGVCATAAGTCSLRAAIDEANRRRGADAIHFDIPGPSPHVIRVTGSSLTAITDRTGGLTIDGYTQPGSAPNTDPVLSNARLGVVIEGPGPNAAGTGIARINGLYVTSPSNTIRGLAIHRFWRNVWMATTGAHHNRLVGSWVGIGATPDTWVPAPRPLYTNGGVMLDDAHHNVIGAPTLADRNVISGTYGSGVYLTHQESSFNVVQNNIIGLSPSGDRAVANHSHGVDLNFGSKSNLIGGTGPLERNVLSGNLETGVELSHAYSPYVPAGQDISAQWSIRDNRIIGNYIGFLPDGNVTAYSRNVGDARMEGAIHIEDWIVDNVIAENWITHTAGADITLQKESDRNVIRDNHFGVSPTGAPAPHSLAISMRQNCSGNVIVGNEMATGNGGIWIVRGASHLNTISRNTIRDIAGMAIDLNVDGATANDLGDADTGANHSFNHPESVVATTSAVSGRSCPSCSVEVFVSQSAAGAPGIGMTYLGTARPDSAGAWSLPVALTAGQRVTTTATSALGETSEFSPSVLVETAPPPPVAGDIVAQDGFARTIAGGWGAAAAGGPYALVGDAAAYAVADGWGTMRLAAGATREGWLPSISALDVDMAARVRTDKAAAGGNAFAYLTGRRAANGDAYRAKVRMAPGGAVYVQAIRSVGGAESALGPEMLVPGLTHLAGAPIRVRATITGTYPTTVAIRAWAEGAAEPAAATATATDATGALQRAGAVGLRAYLGAAATNAPLTVGFGDWTVTLR